MDYREFAVTAAEKCLCPVGTVVCRECYLEQSILGDRTPRQSDLNRALVPKGKEFIEVCKLLEFNGKSCV